MVITHIVISGMPGAGKTTIVGHRLREEFGYGLLSGGDARGKVAASIGKTIDELNKIGEEPGGEWTDTVVDDYFQYVAEHTEYVLFEGWCAGRFVPRSVKIFLDVSARVGGERVYNASIVGKRPDERKYSSVEDCMAQLKERVESSWRRYMKLYEYNYTDMGNYDMWLPTDTLSPDEVYHKVRSFVLEKIPNLVERARGVAAGTITPPVIPPPPKTLNIPLQYRSDSSSEAIFRPY